MLRVSFKTIILLSFSCVLHGQNPLTKVTDALEIRYSSSQPVIEYKLKVDAKDLNSYYVEMHVRNVQDTFQVAMVAHPEYDDRFWRYVEDFSVDTKNGNGKVIRKDSALWQIIAPGGEAALHYRIHLPLAPAGQRAAWRPFLAATGGLVGGPQSFMYVVGYTLAPSHITLELPEGWKAATGLELTHDPFTFFAPSVAALVDGPILIGKFKTWLFAVDQVPHRVVYWSLSNAASFDTTMLVNSIKEIVQQADDLFGRLPYREYLFLLQDDAYGSLEHCNSVTLGANSSELSEDIKPTLAEIAHEYFHAWNLMRIRPVEYGDVSYKTPPLSKGLWWSEGLTMFYADLILRRAGLPVYDSTRIDHLERLISRYYSNPGNYKISAEKVSQAEYTFPGMLGDYFASTHLQGELLGTILDLVIRDATNDRKTIDDVMRKMMEKFSGEKGFVSKDIEQVVTNICQCNVQSIFNDHIYGNKPIDFNHYLSLIGLRVDTSWVIAVDRDGKPYSDLRVYAYQLPGDSSVRIGINEPSGCWGRAGLHTGDIVRSVNGIAVTNAMNLRRQLNSMKMGDHVTIEIQKKGFIFKTEVIVSGYMQPLVKIKTVKNPTEKEKQLLLFWLKADR